MGKYTMNFYVKKKEKTSISRHKTVEMKEIDKRRRTPQLLYGPERVKTVSTQSGGRRSVDFFVPTLFCLSNILRLALI